MTMKQLLKYTVAAGILLILGACGNKEDENEVETAKSVPIHTIRAKDTIIKQTFVANIQANKHVEITARIEGILEKIYIDEGQTIKKNQPLFKINDSEFRIELSKATASYNSAIADAKVAEVEVERVQLLVDKKVIAVSELQLAKSKHNALKAKVEQALAEKSAAEKRISYTLITAPFDGVVERLPLKEGSLVAMGSLLTTISDIHAMYAYFTLSEQDYFRLIQLKEKPESEKVELILPDGSLYPHAGNLQFAVSEIEESTGSITFRANFPNPNNILKHGASAKLLIEQALKNVILIPQKAVFEVQDKNYVFMLGANNTIKQHAILPIGRIASFYQIQEGLKGNDQIVLEGIQNLRDGDTISPIKQ